MFAPILCLSLFAVSAWASVELHGVLELPRAVRSLTESQRFKRQFGSDRATQCISSCGQDFVSTIQSLGMEESATGLLNSRLYEPDTFNSFCDGVDQWNSCSGACSYSQTKDLLVKTFNMFDSLCGEDRETFESHQACYAESDPQQNRVCDPKCGGQEEVKEEMNKLKSAVGDLDAIGKILNRACEMTSCQIDCRTPIIYAACKDKEAAFFIGRWAQKTLQALDWQALRSSQAGRNLGIQCDDITNFNPDKFNFDEEPETDVEVVTKSGEKLPEADRNKHKYERIHVNRPNPQTSVEWKDNLAPKSAIHSLFLIVVSMVFAGLFV